MTEGDGLNLIAKFSSSNDSYGCEEAKFIAMRLAASCGLKVALVSLIDTNGKDLFLNIHFDRAKAGGDSYVLQ